MAVNITDLEAPLKAKIFDLADFRIRESLGTGDASRTLFYVEYPPIESDSQVIFVEKVSQVETTDYTFNDDTGEVTFNTAPVLGAAIEATYQGLYLRLSDLKQIISNAVEELSLIYRSVVFSLDTDNDIIPVPTQQEKWLIIFQARLSVIQGETQRAARDATRFSRTGMSVDTTRRAEYLGLLCDKLQIDLEKKVTAITLTGVYDTTDVSSYKW